MIKRVLIITFIFFIIGLFLFWLLTGGLSAALRAGSHFTNPIDMIFNNGTSTGTFFKLPWQPEIPQGPDISDFAEPDPYNQVPGSDQEVDPSAQASNIRSFGNPSPYVGKIHIISSSATESDPSAERIELEASADNTESISITNWSLQSAVSGLRIAIPSGTSLFAMGALNNAGSISLEPRAVALVTTGVSPIGISFKENMCSGYLDELQTFVPNLSSSCPLGSQALQQNAENLRAYGPNCFDYVNTIPQCHFPTSLPADLSPACRSFITDTLSYNGCLNTFQNDPLFPLPSWRIYLSLRAELWYNTHDVVRLLDEQGRTVDVLTY